MHSDLGVLDSGTLGRPEWKQMGHTAAWEATFGAVQSWTDWLHQVVPPVLSTLRGAYLKWVCSAPMANGLTYFTYILTIFSFDISCYTNMEYTPCGPLLFTPSFISSTDICVHHWATHPYILSLSLVSPLLNSYYNILGLWIKGESPDGAPHMITSE
jgi:hypothetical protein